MKTLPRFWFETRPWVDGVWQPTDGTIAVRNPATGAVLAEVGRADERLVTRAIDGAARAFRSRCGTPAAGRHDPACAA